MKEIQLKDVKVGQGFYVKETGLYYNRVTLTAQITGSFHGAVNWAGFIPVVGPKWELGFMEESTIVFIED
jgi:hypothetical protein